MSAGCWRRGKHSPSACKDGSTAAVIPAALPLTVLFLKQPPLPPAAAVELGRGLGGCSVQGSPATERFAGQRDANEGLGGGC